MFYQLSTSIERTKRRRISATMGFHFRAVRWILDRSGIHGLKYITEKDRHWTERILWAVSFTAAATVLFSSSYKIIKRSRERPVSFVQDTSYLEWNTQFPSVSVCETDADLGNIGLKAEEIFGEDRDLTLDIFLRETAFFDGKCFSCSDDCGSTLECPENIEELAKQARVPCEDLLSDCSWNGIEFDCCQHFLPLESEVGPCFTINSLQTSREPVLDMTSNLSSGPGVLSFSTHRETFVFLQAREDVPFINIPEEFKELVMMPTELILTFQVSEIENDEGLEDISPTARKCRFPAEPFLSNHKAYSYSACVSECRVGAHVDKCNCTHVMRTKGQVPVCTVHQLECLTKYSELFSSLKPLHSTGNGLACGCLSSCTEPDLTIVSKLSAIKESSEESHVIVKFQNLPSKKFKRSVYKTEVDNFVAIGGLLGLYLGASILSLVELIYLAVFRGEKR